MTRVRVLATAIAMLAVAGCSSTSPGAQPAQTYRFVDTPAPPAQVDPRGGTIVFGTKQDPATLEVSGQRSTFRADQKVAWTAYLSEPAGRLKLTEVFVRRGSGGVETPIVTQDVNIANPTFSVLGNTMDLSLLPGGTGSYGLRFYRDSTLLATGDFRVVP